MEQFWEYLLWKLFLVKTDNNLLTYIMATPNLDGTQHCWLESLTGFTFSIEYQKGWDNAATDDLNQVTLRLDAETMKSLLDIVTVGSTGRADAHDPVVTETDDAIHQDNLLKFLYSLPLKEFSWYSLKEKMKAEFSKGELSSHSSLTLTNCKQWRDESLTSFIYKWGGLLLQNCCITAE